jgi:hypothetical protein
MWVTIQEENRLKPTAERLVNPVYLRAFTTFVAISSPTRS